MNFPLGLNLSFGIKRWLGGELMAHVVRDQLGCDCVQFSWDLIDPWWPAEIRNPIARDYAKAFRKAGIALEGNFAGLASYNYNHFLAPTAELRALGETVLKRAVDLTSEMESGVVGMPLGSYSAEDALSCERRARIYGEACERLIRVASYARSRGLNTIMIEPVPLATEFPASASDALKLMSDLEGVTDIPVRLIVDWGHALFEPLFGEEASMDHWMSTCGDYIDAFHLQQTDGCLDRHWSFTRDGIVTSKYLKDFAARHELSHKPTYLEILYPYEQSDDEVLEDMKSCVNRVREAFDDSPTSF